MSARAPVYRNIDRRIEWFGIEPLDAAFVALGVSLLMLLSPDTFALDLLAGVGLCVILRVVTRNKPDGYLQAYARFYFARSPVFCALEPDTEIDSQPPPWRQPS